MTRMRGGHVGGVEEWETFMDGCSFLPLVKGKGRGEVGKGRHKMHVKKGRVHFSFCFFALDHKPIVLTHPFLPTLIYTLKSNPNLFLFEVNSKWIWIYLWKFVALQILHVLSHFRDVYKLVWREKILRSKRLFLGIEYECVVDNF